jgi:hypothetical protein
MAPEPYLIVVMPVQGGQWVVACGGCKREVARVGSRGAADRENAQHRCGAAA